MNRVLRLLGLFILGLAVILFLRGPATSQSGARSAQPMIGVVNIQDAILATRQGKKEFDVLQATFAPRQNELKALNDQVEAMKTDIKARGDRLNEEERNRQRKTLEAKQKTLQVNYEAFKNDLDTAEQQITNRIGEKMLDVLSNYGSSHGMDVIIDVSDLHSPVLWVSQRTNITKDLVDAYDAKYPQR